MAQRSASFTRPANTTAYSDLDLVANSTTAGSVVPLALSGQQGWLRRVQVRKSGTSVTSATFRLWLLGASPTVSNGDNGALAGNFIANVIGTAQVAVDHALSDGAAGWVTLDSGLIMLPDVCFGLLQARAAYTPASGEVFTVTAFTE